MFGRIIFFVHRDMPFGKEIVLKFELADQSFEVVANKEASPSQITYLHRLYPYEPNQCMRKIPKMSTHNIHFFLFKTQFFKLTCKTAAAKHDVAGPFPELLMSYALLSKINCYFPLAWYCLRSYW